MQLDDTWQQIFAVGESGSVDVNGPEGVEFRQSAAEPLATDVGSIVDPDGFRNFNMTGSQAMWARSHTAGVATEITVQVNA